MDPREREPTTKVHGHDRLSGSRAASAPPHVTATDALDVAEQILQLQALAELRAAGILTDAELTDLKRRVLSSGSDAPVEARYTGTLQAPDIRGPTSAEAAAGNGRVRPSDTPRTGKAPTGVSSPGVGARKERDASNGVSGPVLDRRVPKGSYVTDLTVVGTKPVTWRVGANKRPSYVSWKAALDAAAAKAAVGARPKNSELSSLRIELRLYASDGQGSDLDNYVKPIQDALAEQGVFGRVAHEKSPMKVTNASICRRAPPARELRGGGSVLAEVWALDA